MSANDYNRKQRETGALVDADVLIILESNPNFYDNLADSAKVWQKAHGLTVDGYIGPKTIASIQPELRSWPLVVLPDGRQPVITSGFKDDNPDRPTHNGIDLFYRWYDSDPNVPKGEGLFDSQGRRKWWYPPQGLYEYASLALAAAPGIVTDADDSSTGHRVWIDHGFGLRTGYFHMSELFVAEGDVVTMASALGVIGYNPKDGAKTKHLHFEVSPVEKYAPQNPRLWLADATFLQASS